MLSFWCAQKPQASASPCPVSFVGREELPHPIKVKVLCCHFIRCFVQWHKIEIFVWLKFLFDWSFYPLFISFQSLVTFFQPLLTSFRSLVKYFQPLVTSSQSLNTTVQSLVITFQYFDTSFQPVVTSFQSLATSFQSHVTIFQPIVTPY